MSHTMRQNSVASTIAKDTVLDACIAYFPTCTPVVHPCLAHIREILWFRSSIVRIKPNLVLLDIEGICTVIPCLPIPLIPTHPFNQPAPEILKHRATPTLRLIVYPKSAIMRTSLSTRGHQLPPPATALANLHKN